MGSAMMTSVGAKREPAAGRRWRRTKRVPTKEIEESQHAGLGGLFRVWVATVVIALGGAFAGAAVLVYAFTGGLAR